MAAKIIYSLKQEFDKWWGFLLVISASVLTAHGYFLPDKNSSAISMIFLAALLFAVTWKLFMYKESSRKVYGRTLKYLKRMEAALLYTAGAAVFIQYTGGSNSVFYPITYVVSLLIAAFYSPWVFLPVLAIQSGVEFMGIKFAGSGSIHAFYIHTAFNIFFTFIGYLTFRLEILKLKKEQKNAVNEQISRINRDAKDFRLIGTSVSVSSHDREQMEELMHVASIENIRQSIYQTLCILRESMRMTSVVLLWLDNSGKKVSIKEISTVSNAEIRDSFDSKQGLIGSVVRNRLPLNIGDLRFDYRALPYYASPQEIHSFAGVPVMEKGQLRGVICADRISSNAFEAFEIDVFKKASEQIMHMITTERIVNHMEQSKFEQEKFFHASSLMNEALNLNEVIESSFETAGSIIDFSTALLISCDEDNNCRILGHRGNMQIPESAFEFSCKKSLLYMVFANRHYLPVNGELQDSSQEILGNGLDFGEMNSVLILPLISGDKVIGAFVLASEKSKIFTSERRDMLGVIANQIAISLQNALMYEKLEQMATTDGLTKLTNHRTFQEKFDEMLARAKRNNTPLSVFITDIDKFKSVNDTYGHPIGDEVIKRVASILKKQARNIDLVARYGGEEFAVVLESTDSKGAKILAERIRREIEAQVFDSPLGQFKTSISLGIATFPHDSIEKSQLIKKADESLYWAKEHGRNQVVYYGDIH